MKSVYIMKFFVNGELVLIVKTDKRYMFKSMCEQAYKDLSMYLSGIEACISTQLYISYTHKTKDICEVMECL